MYIQKFTFRLLFTILAGFLIQLKRQWDHKADVTRIIGQVITRTGFLSAVIIYKEELNIHGLAIAAAVLSTYSIGYLAAAGFLSDIIIFTIVVLTINLLLVSIEKWLSKKLKIDST